MDRTGLTNNVAVRCAVPGDAGPLARVIDRAYAVYAGRIRDLPDVSAGVEQDISDNQVWVASRGDSLLGGLILIARPPDYALLANLAVDPDAAGAGLGRALIARAETYCRDHAIPVVRLSTHVDMPGNIALYAHLGWHETGRSGAKVHMEKRLSL